MTRVFGLASMARQVDCGLNILIRLINEFSNSASRQKLQNPLVDLKE